MNANELTFGVEIETIISYEAAASNGLRIGAYHVGTQVPYLPAGWTAQRDGSLCGNSNETGCEIVSPVLKGAEGLRQVIEVVRILKAKGHRVNATCGLHVHVGWNSDRSDAELARLVCTVGYLEKAIYAVTGTKNRERGHFCKKIGVYADANSARSIALNDRYHGLNLRNLADGSKRTVEFRFFAGTINEIKLVGYVQLCLGIVEKAVNSKKAPKFNPQSPRNASWGRDGSGHSEVNRMLDWLRWTDHMARKNNGHKHGIIDETISVDAIRKEFRRLAEKYDSMA